MTPQNVTQLEVFVAGPDDVLSEKKVVRDEIDDLRSVFSDLHGFTFQVTMWPDDIGGGFGESPQEVINRQTVDQCDVFIGILWSTFGSSTEEGGSGTEEEFDRVYRRYEDPEDYVAMRIFFKDAPPDRMKFVESDEWARVVEFKGKVSNLGGLYREFLDEKELRRQVRKDLRLVVENWKAQQEGSLPTEQSTEKSEADETVEAREEGFFDLLEQGKKASSEAVQKLLEMKELNEGFTSRMQKRKAELSKLDTSKPSGVADARKVIDGYASDMSEYADELGAQIDPLSVEFETAVESWSRAATLWSEDFEGDSAELEESLEAAVKLESAVETLRSRIGDFQNTMGKIPRASTRLIHSRAKITATLGRLQDSLQLIEKQTGDAADQFRDLLDS